MIKCNLFFMACALMVMGGLIMGKAEIVSGGDKGLYEAKILYDKEGVQKYLDRIDIRLESLDIQVEDLEIKIDELEAELPPLETALEAALAELQEALEEYRSKLIDWHDRHDRWDGVDVPVNSAGTFHVFDWEGFSIVPDSLQRPRPDPKTGQESERPSMPDIPEMGDHLQAKGELDAKQGEIDRAKNALDMKKLEKAGLEKRRQQLNTLLTTLDEDVRSVWCADRSEDLSGEVQTMEVKGQPDQIILTPGYVDPDTSEPHWNMEAGALTPILGMTPAQAAFNFAIHPGWQKHKPTYRTGTIAALDTDLDTATVTLDPAFDRYQSMDINQAETLTDIPVEYMDCNATAFEVGDLVVVEFAAQDWTQPRVVGFVSEPKGCGLTVIAAGWDIYDQVSGVNGQTGIKAISAGGGHSLLLTEHGTVIAVGNDSNGQVSGVNGQTGIKAISAGRLHSLLLTEHGTVIAAGWDYYDQVSGVNGRTGIKAISAGRWHSLLLTEHGTVIAVGLDTYDQVSGVNGRTGIKAISAGDGHSLLLTEHGTVIAVGDDWYGQVSGVNGQTGIKAISAGNWHSLLLTEHGTVIAAGNDSNGQVSGVNGQTGIKAISGGSGHSLLLER